MGSEVNDTAHPFIYPAEPHIRRHGPFGYENYNSYRDWLRDEFCFRCVFCLKREQWDIVDGNWDIDHFIPQCVDPGSALSYENLLYICHSCNILKSSHLVPDPCNVAYGQCLAVHDDGEIEALNEDGEILIEMLRLKNKNRIYWRHLLISTFRCLANEGRTEILTLWMRFPEDLPDLSKLRPSGNAKPDGVKNSYYARRARGELLETY